MRPHLLKATMRSVENLSRKQRRATPLPFAMYLLAGVWRRYQCDRVAVLWTAPGSNYGKLWPWVQIWSARMDARTYVGPYPVICHPPCGCWGKYKAVCRDSREHGIRAMEFVHRWGGVVEQPVGSELFRVAGDGRKVERIDQGEHGHLAVKPTLLYWV